MCFLDVRVTQSSPSWWTLTDNNNQKSSPQQGAVILPKPALSDDVVDVVFATATALLRHVKDMPKSMYICDKTARIGKFCVIYPKQCNGLKKVMVTN